MKVSAVVTTRNSGGTLEACLLSLRAQTHPDLEVVVVDNHSGDATPEIGRRLADVFEQAGPERSRQRNLGLERGAGELLLFLDSDMVLPPPVVAEGVAAIAAGADAVIIPEVSVGDGFWARCKAFERSFYPGDDRVEAARLFRRELLARIGGFDETLTGPEDWDLTVRARAAGAAIARTATPLTHDEGHLTLRETMAAKLYYGRSMPAYIRKHPQVALGQVTPFRPAFLRHPGTLARDPVHTGGMLAMKVAESAAGLVGTVQGLWRGRA
ncbi:MAG TPA: glycosyltransferase family A protein [Candidatus Dormibacteraeota bacterium]|jgi:GT2 family glycosyltransferase|nr:glycosyltransferase family A protein [Candidatus Dormibacteraeota bacterium]